MVHLAHEGHLGIAKTKACLQTKVWWPKIDADAEQRCRMCHGCQVAHLLVIVEYYGQPSEVVALQSVTSAKVTEGLKPNFALWIPESLRTDNGPQFIS